MSESGKCGGDGDHDSECGRCRDSDRGTAAGGELEWVRRARARNMSWW